MHDTVGNHITPFDHVHLQWFGTALPTFCGSRLANATRGWLQLEDVDHTGWTKTDDFIVALAIDAIAKDTPAMSLVIRWRNETDNPGGAFTELTGAGELTWSATTNLVNGNAVVTGEAGCTGAGTWVDGVEREGANAIAYTLLKGYWTEFHWAIDCDNAHDGDQYTFELYDNTSTTTIGTALAQITMAVVGGETYPVSAADGLALSDSSANTALWGETAIDGIAFSDLPSEIGILGITVSDGIAFSDTSSETAQFGVSSADGIAFSDSTEQIRALIVSASDSLALSDGTSRIALFSETASDGLALGELPSELAIFLRTVLDEIAVSDDPSETRIVIVTSEDGIAFSDTTNSSGSTQYNVEVVDGVALADDSSRQAQLLKTIIDGLNTGDLVSQTYTPPGGVTVVYIGPRDFFSRRKAI